MARRTYHRYLRTCPGYLVFATVTPPVHRDDFISHHPNQTTIPTYIVMYRDVLQNNNNTRTHVKRSVFDCLTNVLILMNTEY